MEVIMRGPGIRLSLVNPARPGLLKNPTSTDLPTFPKTTAVTPTASPTPGATPRTQKLDGSFVTCLSAVCLEDLAVYCSLISVLSVHSNYFRFILFSDTPKAGEAEGRVYFIVDKCILLDNTT